jgi:hypothetical protein
LITSARWSSIRDATTRLESAHAEKRAALDYEVNVRTWRLVTKLDGRLDGLVARLDRIESNADAGGRTR